MLATILPSLLAHPLGYCAGTAKQIAECQSYNLYSGAGSDVSELSIVVALLAALAAWWHHHNCHVKGCWRLQWHPHPDHGHPVCRKHHPHEVSEAGRRPRQAR